MTFGDFFRPKYKHSNELVRSDAVGAMEADSVQLFTEIATTDSSTKVRKVAIERIADPDRLLDVAHQQDQKELRSFAFERAYDLWINEIEDETLSEDEALAKLAQISDKKTLAKLAATSSKRIIRSSALHRINEDRLLATVVRMATRGDDWRPAIERIADVSTLRGIAIDETRKQIATAAVDRIDDVETLEHIVLKAKNKGASSRAKRRLKERRQPVASAVSTISQEQLAHAEQVQITRILEEYSMGNEWQASHIDAQERVARWDELVGQKDPDALLAKRYNKAKKLYFENHSRYTVKTVAAVAVEESRVTDSIEDETTKPYRPEKEVVRAAITGLAIDPNLDSDSSSSIKEALEKHVAEPELEAKPQDSIESLIKDTMHLSSAKKLKGFERRIKKSEERRRAMGRQISADDAKQFDDALRKAKMNLVELREADDWKRWANTTAMEKCVERAVAMRESAADIEDLAQKLKDLQAEWKRIGPAPKAKSEALWAKFKIECDGVYEVVKSQRAALDEVYNANMEQKLELCEQAEELSTSEEWSETAARLKELQVQWKAIGPVPKRRADRVWKRFQTACDAFFERRRPHLEQEMNELNQNLADKEQIVSDIERLAKDASMEHEDLISRVKGLQQDYKAIGHVPTKDFHQLNTRYRGLCDEIFARREKYAAQAMQQAQEKVDALHSDISEIRNLMWDESAQGVGDAVMTLRANMTMASEQGLNVGDVKAKFDALALDALTQFPAQFQNTELDPMVSRSRKEKICARIEEMLPKEEVLEASDAEAVANRLRNAIASNAMASTMGVSQKLNALIGSSKLSWSKLGPVPGAKGKALEERFMALCEQATVFQ